MHPRSFVLESATSAAKIDVYNKALECLEKEYLVVKNHCKTRCFGVPQMGARVYYVGLCYEELDPAFKGKSDRILRDFVQSQLVKLQTSSDPRNHAGYNKSFDFRKFLQKEGLEVRVGQSTTLSSSSESEESSMSSESMHCPPHPCRCAVGVHCPAHPCMAVQETRARSHEVSLAHLPSPLQEPAEHKGPETRVPEIVA